MKQVTVVNFYKFVDLPDYRELKLKLLNECNKLDLKGTILLAEEGINVNICGQKHWTDQFVAFLKEDERFKDVEPKESLHDDIPFTRMKVRIKKEIVSIGVPEAKPSDCVGTYVEPSEWNDLISDPEVVVIDTRNDYECHMGTFKNAINPDIKSFRQFPQYAEDNLTNHKDKKVAMFCTGGIRCEKTTALLMKQGFKHVFHLKGGILKYIEEVPEDDSLWEGECFVFDKRVSVDHNLNKGTYELCFGCRGELSQEDLQSEQYEFGICCPHCVKDLTLEKRKRLEMRIKNMMGAS